MDQHPLIHGIFFAFDLLIILMPFSCKDNDISRLSVVDGIGNGFFSVNDLYVFAFRPADAGLNVVNDRLGLLISWIIGGNDGQVCQLPLDLSHLISAQLGTVSAAAEKTYQTVGLVFL